MKLQLITPLHHSISTRMVHKSFVFSKEFHKNNNYIIWQQNGREQNWTKYTEMPHLCDEHESNMLSSEVTIITFRVGRKNDWVGSKSALQQIKIDTSL